MLQHGVDDPDRGGDTASSAEPGGGAGESRRKGQVTGGRPPPDVVRGMGVVVEREAKRVLSENAIRPDPELIAEGWERRFVADARRAEEAMDLYAQLGFEVRAEPADVEELGDDCSDCQLLLLLQFRTIYTRRR